MSVHTLGNTPIGDDITGIQGQKGLKGDKGDTGAAGASVTGPAGPAGNTGPQGAASTVPGPAGANGVAGTTPEKGVDYFDSNFIEYQYAVNSSTTVPPSIVVSNLNPTGWSTIPPTLDVLEYMWITKARKTYDGQTLIENWSTPSRFSGIASTGIPGATGMSSRTVVMSVTDQTFEYDYGGANPYPATATITATAVNLAGGAVAYYDFLVDGVSKQNTTTNTYTYTPQALHSNMPEMLQVDLREDANTGTILASDLTTALGLKAGTDTITVDISNQSAALFTSRVGTVNFNGSGTTIEVYVGTAKINIDKTGPPYNYSTYRVSAIGSNITPSVPTEIDGTTTTTYGNHNTMTADNAYITYTIVVTNSVGTEMTFIRKQTFAKSWEGIEGLRGADGDDGSAGSDSRGVALTTTTQGFSYTTAGTTPSPASATVTATPVNTAGTVYYQFFKNDVSQGVPSTTATYTYTPQAAYSSMPDKIEVQIRENGGGNPILARDQMTMVGLRAGGHSYTIVLSNEAHTLPTTAGGTVTYTGSGTSIMAWEGNTQLTVDQNSAYGNSTFRVTGASGTNITVGSASGADGATSRVYGDHSAMTVNTASITYTIVVKSSEGVETTFTKLQTFAKSWEGAVGVTGAVGPTGAAGLDGAHGAIGPTPVFRGVYSAGVAYYGNAQRVDIVQYPAGGSYYVVRSDCPGGGTTGIVPTNTTYWNAFGATFDSIATGLLFAERATVDNLYVKEFEGVAVPAGDLSGNVVNTQANFAGTYTNWSDIVNYDYPDTVYSGGFFTASQASLNEAPFNGSSYWYPISYPSDATQQIDTVTLTSSAGSGAANITCNGVTKPVNLYSTLTDAAATFVSLYGTSFGSVTVTSASADIVFTANTPGVGFSGYTSVGNVPNVWRGSIKIEGNSIYENEQNNNDYGAIGINLKGYDGGTTRYRTTVIGNGRGKSLLVVSGNSAPLGDIIQLNAPTVFIIGLPTGASAPTGRLYKDSNGFLKIGAV